MAMLGAWDLKDFPLRYYINNNEDVEANNSEVKYKQPGQQPINTTLQTFFSSKLGQKYGNTYSSFMD